MLFNVSFSRMGNKSYFVTLSSSFTWDMVWKCSEILQLISDFLKYLKTIYIGTDEYSVKCKLTNVGSLVL